MRKFTSINITGHRFGRLVVLEFTNLINGRSHYLCKCDCGKIVEKKSHYLLSGDTKSCGCLKSDSAIINSKKAQTHGLTKHPLYKVWDSMKYRCLNKNCHAYPDYGGRGIGVSEEWLVFQNFYNDVEPTYKKGLELDRVNNDKGYSKDNFRWATPTVNKRNRRVSVFLTVNGVTKHIAQWAEETGISRHSIFSRMKYLNKVGEEALYGTRKLKHGV